ncbi:MAG: hypothetical protein ACE5JZ_04255 [Kiloniellales bacterium]
MSLDSLEERLSELKELYEEDLIAEAHYDAKKRELVTCVDIKATGLRRFLKELLRLHEEEDLLSEDDLAIARKWALTAL